MNETAEKRNIILEVIFIICIAIAAMGDYGGFHFVNDITRMFKAAALFTVVVALGVMFVSGNLNRIKQCASFVGVYGFILIGIIIWSIFLWIINLETIEFILRGAFKFIFQCSVLLIIFAAVYLFGERSIYTVFYGLAIANTLMIIIGVCSFGPSESWNSLYMMLTTGEQQGFARALEIHDITFTYGFFIIYFLFFAQHGKERTICITAALLYFVLGWKRISIVALVITVFLGLILGRMKSSHRIPLMKMLAWIFVIASFAYVLMVRFRVFEMITAYFNLDTMGRNEVYEYIRDYYKISIGFMGYGFEYATVLLQKVIETNPDAHIGVLGLHNNILTEYIELGFIGFWAWIIYTWVFQLRWMLNHWGEKTAMLFFFCELYIFITYTTDNTLYYFFSSMVLRLMPMAYSFHIRTSQDVHLWPWVRVQKRQILR